MCVPASFATVLIVPYRFLVPKRFIKGIIYNIDNALPTITWILITPTTTALLCRILTLSYTSYHIMYVWINVKFEKRQNEHHHKVHKREKFTAASTSSSWPPHHTIIFHGGVLLYATASSSPFFLTFNLTEICIQHLLS